MMTPNPDTARLLHVGCGTQTKQDLKGFSDPDWQEFRYDLNPSVAPDILGDLVDMSAIESSSFDAIYSSHNIEHVFPHEVSVVLESFFRVLKPNGFVVLTCPDLQKVAEAVSRDQLTETLYESPAGPITALDVIYGHTGFIQKGNVFMAHKTGFTYKTLRLAFQQAGFRLTLGGRFEESFALWILAVKGEMPQQDIVKLAERFFP
ncbi:MAG: class I SAM-dependent methyltransferase [Burkholderiaceae bacterium]